MFRPQSLNQKEIETLIRTLEKSGHLTITSTGEVNYPNKTHPLPIGGKASANR